MLSKIKRSKSEVHERPRAGLLRGMPALKQMRSSKRQENQYKLHMNLQTLSSYKSPSSKIEGLGLQTNLSETKNVLSQPYAVNCDNLQIRKSTSNDFKFGKTNNLTDQKKSFSTSSMVQTHSNDHDRSSSLVQQNRRVISSNSPSKLKKDKNRGQNLINIKKQRKAQRERNVTKSMRALTPRERESIMCLEEVLKEHEISVISEHKDNAKILHNSKINSTHDVFETNGTSDTESDVGSIIDLVGNLSNIGTGHCTTSSAVPSNTIDFLGTLNDINISNNKNHFLSNQIACKNSFLNLKHVKKIVKSHVYSEIDSEEKHFSAKPAMQHDLHLESDKIYAEIQEKHDGDYESISVTHNSTAKQEWSATAEKCNAVFPLQLVCDPAYAVVKKPKKANKAFSRQEAKANQFFKANSESRVVTAELANKEKVLTKSKSISLENISAIHRTNIPANKTEFRDKLKTTSQQDETKNRKLSNVSSHVMEDIHDNDAKTTDIAETYDISVEVARPVKLKTQFFNKKKNYGITESPISVKVQDHLNCEQTNDLTKPSACWENAQDKTNNNSTVPIVNSVTKMLAVPRQTTFSSDDSSRFSKPFVITPAAKRVVGWN